MSTVTNMIQWTISRPEHKCSGTMLYNAVYKLFYFFSGAAVTIVKRQISGHQQCSPEIEEGLEVKDD